jgi:hypothetical protein
MKRNFFLLTDISKNEFLDYQFMAKAVARSASRALGLLIVKSKTHGGFQHNIFTKLFDTLVWSVIIMALQFGDQFCIY